MVCCNVGVGLKGQWSSFCVVLVMRSLWVSREGVFDVFFGD